MRQDQLEPRVRLDQLDRQVRRVQQERRAQQVRQDQLEPRARQDQPDRQVRLARPERRVLPVPKVSKETLGQLARRVRLRIPRVRRCPRPPQGHPRRHWPNLARQVRLISPTGETGPTRNKTGETVPIRRDAPNEVRQDQLELRARQDQLSDRDRVRLDPTGETRY